MKKALQPSANNVAVTFDLPSNYQVKVIPEMMPSIYNGEKIVIYCLLMEKLEQKGESMKCKATLTGDIIGKTFKFDIPFELTKGESEEGVSVIHQLAVKKMIQEWQDDGEPYEEKHKKEIIELSTDASVVSMYTAYIAVDVAQNKPVSGSMQSYELVAAERMARARGSRRAYSCAVRYSSGVRPMAYSATPTAIGMTVKMNKRSVTKSKAVAMVEDEELESSDEVSRVIKKTFSPKQTEINFIVSLQQANGSWLLNDQLAGVVSKSVEELKSCCPVSCDDTVMANVWATLVVIELLKKKYPSMLEELGLVIMKAEQWLSKQALPSGINLAILKEGIIKMF